LRLFRGESPTAGSHKRLFKGCICGKKSFAEENGVLIEVFSIFFAIIVLPLDF